MGKNYNSVSGSTQGNMPVSSAQDAARSLPPGRATAHRPPPTALTHPSTNTKNELGPCPKVHNEALKTEYQDADAEQKRRWGFDFDYLRDMQHHIDGCNRKIDQAQRRLEKTPEEIRQTNALVRTREPC